jgi:hypothetical protein
VILKQVVYRPYSLFHMRSVLRKDSSRSGLRANARMKFMSLYALMVPRLRFVARS